MKKTKQQTPSNMKRKKNKKNLLNKNQKSFYFQDYIETSLEQKNNSKSFISEDRIYLIFFVFFCLVSIFSIKIIFLSIQDPKLLNEKKEIQYFLPLRRDIVDRNDEILSRNVKTYHAAVRPSLIKDKNKFLINIKLNFPNIPEEFLKKKLSDNKYFYLKKRLTAQEREKLYSLGEKGIIFEPFQSRIYPHSELYSHILGQTDDDNYGVSGIENFFDRELRDVKKIKEPLKLTLDTNLQFLIKKELEKSVEDFKVKGAASLLMDVKSGEILSLVSLPDYNINMRKNINDPIYSNKITKSVFELGSVFKTFTIALALEKKILLPTTIIEDIPENIICSKYKISEHEKLPNELSVKDILVRSSNIGSTIIAQKIGEESFKEFFEKLGLLKTPDLELEEVGTPLSFNWEDCKLETVSFGHGVTTTPLQAATAYAAITNGGYLIKPTLHKDIKKTYLNEKILSDETSKEMNLMLREVVTSKNGTASLADITGFFVGGKTGTAKKNKLGEYSDKKINTFISVFPMTKPRYVLLVLLDEPKPAPHLVYNYRGKKISVNRDESGWNSVYVAGKIIEKIGPILAINNSEFYSNHVVKKTN